MPFCAIATLTLVSLITSIPCGNALVPAPLLSFGGGFVLWLAAFIFLPRPVRAYVLAHELTHAFWGLMMGATVKKMTIRKESGSVVLSKSNILITLAPYFFPLYAVIVVLAYYICAIFMEVEKCYLLWLFLTGLAWGFHVTFTITSLLQKQSDIRMYGHVFSYVFIYLLNVVGITFWIIMISPATLEQAVRFTADHTTRTAKWIQETAINQTKKIIQ